MHFSDLPTAYGEGTSTCIAVSEVKATIAARWIIVWKLQTTSWKRERTRSRVVIRLPLGHYLLHSSVHPCETHQARQVGRQSTYPVCLLSSLAEPFSYFVYSGISVLFKKPVKGAVYLKLLLNGQEFTKLPLKYDATPNVPLRWDLEPFL